MRRAETTTSVAKPAILMAADYRRATTTDGRSLLRRRHRRRARYNPRTRNISTASGGSMTGRFGAIVLLIVLTCAVAFAQQFSPGYVDPAPVLQAAARAIGTDNLRCVTIAGTGYAGMVGQQHLAEKNVDWPPGEPLGNYTRTMNWAAGTMKEEFDRKPGVNPASWKYGPGWTGGSPPQRNPHQVFFVNGKYAWHLDGAGTPPVPSSP